ncbi:MAG: bL17 family ribosomal protein, partial [Bacteroidales bacterium]|nr:bL17 family ribosomal protein [Bacteroidales bacterium]
RPGGYLRILHTGFRSGDASEMVMVELVDFNEAALATKKEVKKTTRRSRAKKAEAAPAEAPVEAPAEAPAEPAAEAPAAE